MPKRVRGNKQDIVIDGMTISCASVPERRLMETYYPLIVPYDKVIVLYRPAKRRATNLIMPLKVMYMKGRNRIDMEITEEMRLFMQKYTRVDWRPDYYIPASDSILEYKGGMKDDFPILVETFMHQHPALFKRYKIAFQKPNLYTPHRKGLTYAKWAESLGIPWCMYNPTLTAAKQGQIPEDWLSNQPSKESGQNYSLTESQLTKWLEL